MRTARISQAMKEKIREDLIWKGLDLFASQGFHATTVDEITKAAGVAKGTFYNYFKTKEDLAVSAMLEVQAKNADAVPYLLSQPLSTMERLVMIFEAASQWVLQNAEVTMVWCVEAIRRGQVDGRKTSPCGESVAAVLAAGQAAGEVRTDRSAAEMSLEIEGIFLAHTATWYHSGFQVDLVGAMSQAVRTYCSGALAQKGSDAK